MTWWFINKRVEKWFVVVAFFFYISNSNLIHRTLFWVRNADSSVTKHWEQNRTQFTLIKLYIHKRTFAKQIANYRDDSFSFVFWFIQIVILIESDNKKTIIEQKFTFEYCNDINIWFCNENVARRSYFWTFHAALAVSCVSVRALECGMKICGTSFGIKEITKLRMTFNAMKLHGLVVEQTKFQKCSDPLFHRTAFRKLIIQPSQSISEIWEFFSHFLFQNYRFFFASFFRTVTLFLHVFWSLNSYETWWQFGARLDVHSFKKFSYVCHFSSENLYDRSVSNPIACALETFFFFVRWIYHRPNEIDRNIFFRSAQFHTHTHTHTQQPIYKTNSRLLCNIFRPPSFM